MSFIKEVAKRIFFYNFFLIEFQYSVFSIFPLVKILIGVLKLLELHPKSTKSVLKSSINQGPSAITKEDIDGVFSLYDRVSQNIETFSQTKCIKQIDTQVQSLLIMITFCIIVKIGFYIIIL